MKLPTIKAVSALLRDLKPTIADDYRAYEMTEAEFADSLPSMLVTIGCDTSTGEWSYQTGDNSYTGSAYHYPTWALVDLHRRTNTIVAARDVLSQLYDLSDNA